MIYGQKKLHDSGWIFLCCLFDGTVLSQIQTLTAADFVKENAMVIYFLPR
jgi:hypothetical protein